MSNNKNRRKGNAQTASSSRAAELLQASGISIPYLGLDALNLTAGLPTDVNDVNQLIDEIGANVDPELRIIFKKLTKRDLQTREKAAKELMDALKESSNDYDKIKNAFPSYASVYSKLVTDSSSSLRSTSNSILALFVATLKKDAGSYLKSVIPFLFFSLQDGYVQVAKNAEVAVNDCFPSEEKKKLAMTTFGQEATNICLQMMSRQHKLIQPQKFVELESDAQRQTRLIAQSLNTLEAFIETSPGLAESIAPSFISSQSFANLMNMDPNVKAAAFRLLKNLIKSDVSQILGTRIPSFLLQNLDSTDTLLCRNCFECFLIAGKDPKFFEIVKVDKAVIPKFLSLIRKKGL
uniref:E3 ubiquitin-protein ligase listerin n=1 Tax=Panagrolaimus superbus TaxID=310955 RepID=A0A914Y1N2_9BILA